MHRRTALAVLLTTVCCGSPALAQWTVTNLHPAGAQSSRALGVHSGHQVGSANGHASLWSGAADSWVDLHPQFPPNPFLVTTSTAAGVFGDQQVGTVLLREDERSWGNAARWNGTNSWTNLSGVSWPDTAGANATDGVQIVGSSLSFGELGTRARIWGGANLHPAGATASAALGVHAGQQVGSVRLSQGGLRASLWTGSAGSWVDLSPAGSTASEARGVHAGQQAGFANIGGSNHAGSWTGSASSWVDLHPAGALQSEAMGVYDGQVVGYATVGGVERASLWNGSAGSWEDLSLVLAGSWGNTRAQGIWDDGGTLSIVGFGFNIATNRTEALMWTRPIPAPGAGVLLGVVAMAAGGRRRREPPVC